MDSPVVVGWSTKIPAEQITVDGHGQGLYYFTVRIRYVCDRCGLGNLYSDFGQAIDYSSAVCWGGFVEGKVAPQNFRIRLRFYVSGYHAKFFEAIHYAPYADPYCIILLGEHNVRA